MTNTQTTIVTVLVIATVLLVVLGMIGGWSLESFRRWLAAAWTPGRLQIAGTTPGTGECPEGQNLVDGICQWPTIDVDGPTVA